MKKTTLALAISAAILSGCGGATNDTAKTEPTPTPKPEPVVASNSSVFFATTRDTTTVATTCGTRGGIEVQSGFDTNNNNVLDTTEVTKTQVLCNGETGATGPAGAPGATGPMGPQGEPGLPGDTLGSDISLSQATAEQCPTGGQILHFGEQSVALCNAADKPVEQDYAKVKQMVEGLKVWINNLETLPAKYEEAASAAETQLKPLVEANGDAAGATLPSIQLALAAIAEAASTDKADGDYAITNLVPDLPGHITSATGTITKATDAGVTTLSLSGFTATYMADTNNDDQGDTPIVTSVTHAPVTLPPTTGTVFELDLNNIAANNDRGMAQIPNAHVRVTTTNSVDLTDENADPGQVTMAVNLGAEDAPILLQVKNSAGQPIEFRGLLALEAGKRKLYQSQVIDDLYLEQNWLKSAMFRGELKHESKVMKVHFAFELSNAETYNTLAWKVEDMPAIEQFIQDNQNITITATPVANSSNFLDIEYVTSVGGKPKAKSRLYKFSEADQYYYYQNYSWNEWGRFWFIWDSSNTFSLDFAKSSIINNLFGYGHNGSLAYYSNYFNNDGGHFQLWGTFDLSGYTLPMVADTQTFTIQNFGFTELDETSSEYSDRFNYDNHPLYTLQAGVSIEGFLDANNNPIDTMMIDLDMGSTDYFNDYMKINMSYSGQSFTITYHKGDANISFINFQRSPNEFREPKPDLISYTDKNGGLIHFNPVEFSGDNYFYSITGKQNDAAIITYNGFDYGHVVKDGVGNVIIKYYDGTQDLLYKFDE